MNWSEITEKYPKALKFFIDSEFPGFKHYTIELQNEYGDTYIQTNKGSVVYYLRDLYDFFDGQGVFIEVFLFSDPEIPIFDIGIFYNDTSYYVGKSYDSRKEAEEEAFQKAFEILEKKL